MIFLDFDGVLNSHGYFMRIGGKFESFSEKLSPVHFDRINIEYLEYFLNECPDVKIVISSTWGKIHDLVDIKWFLKVAGMRKENVNRIIEITPRKMFSEKVDDIKMWLTSYKEMNEPVDNYLVIDDYQQLGLEYVFAEFEGNGGFQFVNHTHGFTILDAISCIKFFKPEWKEPTKFI